MCDIGAGSETACMWLTLVAVSLLSDVPPRRLPPPVECRADTDCRLSTFQGCCPGCCRVTPHAVPKHTRENDMCAAVDCAMPDDCRLVRCAMPPPMQVVCRDNRCVAVPVSTPPTNQCRADTDCKVIEQPTSNGCCTARVAVPLETPTPLTKRSEKKPGFGLSTPSASSTCGPCAPPEPGDAACSAGRCVLRVTPRRVPPPG